MSEETILHLDTEFRNLVQNIIQHINQNNKFSFYPALLPAFHEKLLLEKFPSVYDALIKLSESKNYEHIRPQVEELKLRLIEKLYEKMSELYPHNLSIVNDEKTIPYFSTKDKLGLGFIGFCGAIWAAFDSFDGITSLLGIFISAKAFLLFTGLFFSFLGIFIYFGFDLSKISDGFGISLFDVKSLVHTFYKQQTFVKKCYQILGMKLAELEGNQIKSNEKESLIEPLLFFKQALTIIHKDMLTKKNQLEDCLASEPRWKYITKNISSFLAALIFSSAGFFVAKIGVVKLIGYLAIFGLTLSNPVTSIISISVGALALYGAYKSFRWLQLNGMYKLIDKLAGYPQKIIHKFTECKLEKKESETNRRFENIQSTIKKEKFYLNIINDQSSLIKTLESNQENIVISTPYIIVSKGSKFKIQQTENTVPLNSIHNFFQQPYDPESQVTSHSLNEAPDPNAVWQQPHN